jgi:hypothetical protein
VSVTGLSSLELAVVAHAPPGAVVVGASVSADGAYGVALSFLRSANYLMDDVFVRSDEGWEGYGGGSGGGISWTSIGDGERGVLRYSDEAPDRASVAVVQYEGQQHRVPVRHGHFLFVAWNTSFTEDPTLVAYE